MASEFDASCENDPNFAVICAFLEKFGKQCGLPNVDFLELQQMLENSDEVPANLYEILLKLLRKIKKSVKPDKWEKSLVAVAHTFSNIDAWEIERFGFKKAKLSCKVRVVKELLEMQFDYNVKFKNELNKLDANELRSQPLGRDKSGHSYWFHSDDNYQIRIYREDLDDETWTLIAKDRESLASLINKLSDGDTKFSSDSAVNEDSSSLSEKPLIDTGQPESDKKDISDEKTNSIDSSDSKPDNEDNKEAKAAENESSNSDEPKQEEPPRPMLRIKKLSELVDTGVKRQKLDPEFEDKEGSETDAKNVIEGETISEPVMIVKGEGNGEDNESGIKEIWESESCPIVGEEIAEETFYIFGEGSGHDCFTGNEGKAESSEEKSVNSTVEDVNPNDDSIKSTVSEMKDNKEETNEVVSNNLEATTEKKTDNDLDSTDSSKNSENMTENTSDGSKSPVPKKSMFFFGSPLKNTSSSPSAKVEFGQVSPKSKETCEIKPNNDNNNEVDKIEERTKEIESLGDDNSECLKPLNTELSDKSDPISSQNEKMELVQGKRITQEKLMESNEKNNDDVTTEEDEEVKEEPCIKEVAYLCGTAEENHKDKSSEVKNVDTDNIEKSCIKETAYKCGEEKSSKSPEEAEDENNVKPNDVTSGKSSQKDVTSKKPSKKDVTSGKSSQKDVASGKSSQKDVASGKSSQKDVTSGKSSQKDVTSAKSSQKKVTSEQSFEKEVSSEKTSEKDVSSEKSSSENGVISEKDVATKKLPQKTRASAKSSQKDVACDKTSQKEVTSEETSPKDVACDKTSKKDVTSEETSPKDVACDKKSQKDVTSGETSPKDVAGDKSSEKDVTSEETSPKDVACDKTSKKDVTSEETSPKDVADDKSSEKDVTSEETSQKDVASGKLSQKEVTSVKSGSAKSKIENKVSAKNEKQIPSKMDLSKVETPQKTATKEVKETPKSTRSQNVAITKTTTTTTAAARSIKESQLHNSLRYFRTRRTANVKMTSEVRIPIRNIDPVMLAAQRVGITAEPKKPPVETPPKASTEVVYVPDRKAKSKKEREITPSASQKHNKKPKLISDETGKKDDAKTNSSISSPMSAPDSVITLPDSLENSADVPEKDPLADSEAEEKPAPKPVNLTSLSFDYNSSSTPPPMPVIPSRRVLRKRGREASPEPAKIVVNESKKMKMKGKRQINTSLRKSIEEKKEQQASSSDEVHVVAAPKSSKKTPKKKQKSKSKKQPQRKQIKPKNESVEVSEEESAEDEGEDAQKKSNQETKKKKNDVEELSDEDSTSTPKPKPKGKNTRILAGLEISESDLQPIGVRQSRRLAQIKIKEQAEPKKPDKPETKVEKPKKKPEVKEPVLEKRKRTKADDLVVAQVPEIQEKKKKRKKEKDFSSKSFDSTKVWQSSSESSEAEEEVEEEEEVIEEYEPPLEFKSDHEFSPESDIGSDTEYQPMKRARTARKSKELDEEEVEEEFPCQKCGKSDHPEWILLCDKCDNGWHCSCLRPPLLNIPEGDWHCPPCQHILLVENLQKKLEEYDKQLNKKVLEDRRKERLAYVGISLNNVLPSRENEHRKKKRRHSLEEDSEEESISEKSRSSDATESESDSDEPIYQLRQRRQAKSYKFNEYDELIKSAIQDEMEVAAHTKASQSRGKDMATIVKAEEEDRKEKEISESKPEGEIKSEAPEVAATENQTKEYSDDDEPIRPPVRRGGKKKGRKMTNLDSGSEEDDEKDEDFKGSSSSSEEDDFVEESDDDSDYMSAKRKKNLRPVRRSTRVRVSRYDTDFINDDDDDEYPKKKKKKKQMWSETESSDTDGSWKKKKKKPRSDHVKKRKARKKNSILDELSDLEIKRKPKIKYGGLTSSDEDTGRRRTRGKKTTYVDTLGSDSEEERKKRNPHRYIDSDDENDEDFVANEEDEEKDSEEPPEEEDDRPKVEDEEEEEEDKDDEQEERRPLVIPKIYIKKPPVSKEILPAHVNSASKEPVKAAEKVAEKPAEKIAEKPAETAAGDKEKQEKIEEIVPTEKPNTVREQPKVESAKNVSEAVTINPVKNVPIIPASIEIIKNANKAKEESPIVPEDKVVVKEEVDMEEYFSPAKPVVLTALEIEQERKRRALEEAKRLLGSSNSIEIVPIKRGRKPSEPPTKIVSHEPPPKTLSREPFAKMPIHEPPSKMPVHEPPSKMTVHEPPTKVSIHEPPPPTRISVQEALAKVQEMQAKKLSHEPIVSNVEAFIHNDESNDELSEPPSVTLPMFEELATKNGTGVRRKIGKGRPKKTIEEAVASLGGMKKDSPIKVKSESELCIEIAAPPQPFSQASPVPSVITRMLQTSPGQTAAFPVGKIRPKQFATMPADDDDDEPPLPNRSRGGSPQTGPHYSSSHMGQFLSGNPRGGSVNPPYGQMHPNMNPYPRGILPPHQMRGQRPPMPSHMFPPHRMMEPPSDTPLNMSDPSSQHPSSTGAPNMKTDSPIYSRSPSGRYPQPSNQARTSPRPPAPQNVIGHMPQPRPAASMGQYPQQPSAASAGSPSNYYGNYPHSESLASENAMPPSAYQGSPYPEEYAGEGGPETSENSNSKSFGGETEEAGEFGGLVSYFSSQREDDLDS